MAQSNKLTFGAKPQRRTPPAPRIGIAPVLFYGLLALLLATNVTTMVGFLMSPDIAALFDDGAERRDAAYQTRIARLRAEVDRLNSRQYAQTGNINLALHELAQQQQILTEQHEYVRAIAREAAKLGIETAAAPDTSAPGDTLLTGAITGDRGIEAVSRSVNIMMDDTRMALSAITDAATSSTGTIVTELRRIGITPGLPSTPAEGVGGPFEPASSAPDAFDLTGDANAALTALSRFQAARGALNNAPIHPPLSNLTRISSPFGSRSDPFNHKAAFHSGIDFPAVTGTPVRSAATGKVTFAGRRGGYGKMVEIDHGAGLVTRYAHLSAIAVTIGQRLAAGAVLGNVGSTGRSTGPHLHFEVRRNDSPINPARFLTAGQRLSRFL